MNIEQTIKKAIVYANGLPTCSACVLKGMTKEEIEVEVNLVNPTGIDSKWCFSEDKTFKGGEKIPNQCDKDPKREHYLFNC